MKIIEKPVVDVWGPSPTGVGPNMQCMERGGRICYQSQDRINEYSAEPFCKKLCDSGHAAVIEFSWLAVKLNGMFIPNEVKESKFLYHKRDEDTREEYIVGNYRAWAEVIQQMSFRPIGLFSLLTDLPDCVSRLSSDFEVIDNDELPPKFQNFIIRFITNISTTHQMVRHRPASYLQKSMRYCAPPKSQRRADFFPKTVEFLLPWWLREEGKNNPSYQAWEFAMIYAENQYYHLLETNSPQEARSVLPFSTATEIVVATPVWHWIDSIFPLRTVKAADPEIRGIMQEAEVKLYEYFDSEDLV